jgi:hypothetical protein
MLTVSLSASRHLYICMYTWLLLYFVVLCLLSLQALATPEGCWHVSKCDPAAALSDGTPNYLGAAALKLAYDSWDSRGGMQVSRTGSLSVTLPAAGRCSAFIRDSNVSVHADMVGRWHSLETLPVADHRT